METAMNRNWIRQLMTGVVAGALLTTALSTALAQTPPAPTLGRDVDTDGRPLPFGRQPHQANDTRLGSGQYKAIMGTQEGLANHVLYYPADLHRAGKVPVIAWGNGACINAGNRFRYFLTEIASHGYLVIASGPMASTDLEVGPQENPAVRKPGEAAPPPPVVTNNTSRAPGRTTAEQLTEAIDWAVHENERRDSPFYHHIDTKEVAVMGQSCGGVQALTVAGDPRIRAMMIWNSGVGMIPNNPPDPAAALAKIHTPIAYIHGDESHDIAYPASVQNVQALKQVPVFGAWQDGMSHLGTYGAANGGFFAQIAVAWLDWRLKGNATAAKMFRGADCTLCRDPSWHVAKQRID
jgi:dienelactone hydrolase